MPLLFAATLFVSASLLFMVQPMVGKMVLPLLGGSPAVWNACMVFFQLLLLMGYQYAHFVTGKYVPRKQWGIHLLVLALPIAAFVLAVMFGSRHSPIAIAESLAPSGESNPILSVLALLTVAIAIPFFVVSTSAPLLQKWFTATNHPSARDPYFLYSASNAGSLISLLGYPIFIEPNLTIVGQAWVFAAGFVILAVMIFFCGRAAANPIGTPPAAQAQTGGKGGGGTRGGTATTAQPVTKTEEPPTLARKLKWVLLAFVPSTFMLGVTARMTEDIASVPLLWVGPLALYLITFIISFGRVPDWFRIVIGNLAPVMILLLVFVMISEVPVGYGLKLILYMATFFAAALMCHYELARDRPGPEYLTGFFLLMSIGGVLGGVFNSLVAPLIFPHAYEFHLAMVFACLLVPKLMGDEPEKPISERGKNIRILLDFLVPVLVGVGFYLLMRLHGSPRFAGMVDSIAKTIRLANATIAIVFIYAVPVMLCFFFVDRPVRFALCVAVILGYNAYLEDGNSSVYTERSFFGILKVQENKHTLPWYKDNVTIQNPDGTTTKGEVIFKDANDKPLIARDYLLRRLQHGTTLHGTQYTYKDVPEGRLNSRHILDDFQMLFPGGTPLAPITVTGVTHAYDTRQEPLTYYHRTGPVGAMFRELRLRKGGVDEKAPFAMVGLGTGSASCYAQRDQSITFYEIDPAVKHLVADTDKYFTYVQDAQRRGANLDLRMGDARLVLKRDTDRKYALLLIDAFSSDSIPVHLLTVEAVQLYLDRMTDDGMLAMHISNRWIRLEPVVSSIANKLGLVARVWNDDEKDQTGKTASSWVVLARKPEHLGKLYSETGDLPFNLTPTAKGNDRIRYGRREFPDGPRVYSLMDMPLTSVLASDYDDDLDVRTGSGEQRLRNDLNEADNAQLAWVVWAQHKYASLCDPDGSQRLAIFKSAVPKATRLGDVLDAFRPWHDEKFAHQDTAEKKRLARVITLMQAHGVQKSIADIMLAEHGHGFRRLETLVQVRAWTDDYSDVLQVMSIGSLQKIRGFFGLSTPLERSSDDE